MLVRASAISVAVAVKIAAYVLFGTPVALWATVVVVAVNAYTPKPKPMRKILFNFGGMMLSTYLASSTYQPVGGMVPPGPVLPTLPPVAGPAAGALRGGFAHDTGEGGLTEYHLENGGDLIWEIGSGYFGARTKNGDFDPDMFRDKAAQDQVKCVSLKLSQGAKPGIGGRLPAARVNAKAAPAPMQPRIAPSRIAGSSVRPAWTKSNTRPSRKTPPKASSASQ